MKNKKFVLRIISIVFFILGVFLILYSNKFYKKEYKIVFDSLGGTLIENQKVKENEKVTKPNDPIKEGYIFDNWYLNEQLFDFDTKVGENLTLIAKWILDYEEEMKTFKVSFDTMGGNHIQDVIVKKGDLLAIPSTPLKDGYIFESWYLNDQLFDFDNEIVSDINLVAKWKKAESNAKKYTVTFNSSGGNNVPTQTILEKKLAKKPADPTRTGYKFKEWQLNGKTYDFNTKITGNITLTALWEKIPTYTITFNTNGGSNISNQIIEKNGVVVKPVNPTKNGYNFKEWQLNGQTYDFNTKITGNITLSATWTQRKYIVEVSRIDNFSPDRKLLVKEEGKQIDVKAINFSNGVLLSNGNNLIVSYTEITSQNSLIIVLQDGTEVTAGITYVN